MKKPTYLMTPTAEAHFWNALRDTQLRWGNIQAEKYRVQFLTGLQDIAENHRSFHSSYRKKLAEGTDFLVHLVRHRYVAFVEHNEHTVIIAAIFHENMDIPTRLRELKSLSELEIAALMKKNLH